MSADQERLDAYLAIIERDRWEGASERMLAVEIRRLRAENEGLRTLALDAVTRLRDLANNPPRWDDIAEANTVALGALYATLPTTADIVGGIPLTDEEWITYAEGCGFDPGPRPVTDREETPS